MPSILFLDVETNGLLDYRASLDASHQPRMTALGLVLCEASGEVRAKVSLLIEPDGWTIPPEVGAVNHLSDGICGAYGVPLETAWNVLVKLTKYQPLIVAHNVDFDRTILDREWLLHRDTLSPVEGVWFCTKEATTPILKLPGKSTYLPRAAASPYKWPTLAEAHYFFFGTKVEGAHDALADAEACMRVYFALLAHQETDHE